MLGPSKKKFFQVLFFTGCIMVYTVLFVVFYGLIKFGKASPFSSFGDILLYLFLNFCSIYVIAALYYGIVFWLPQRHAYGRNMLLKILIDILSSLAIWIVINQSFFYCIKWLFIPTLTCDWSGALLNSMLLLLIMEIIFYSFNFEKSYREAELAKIETLQYRYEAFRAQVNPHFLFNSLNILYSLVSIDVKKSQDFILSLSEMYRYILVNHTSKIISLEDELNFLKSYVSILILRYNNQFRVSYHGLENIGNKKIVPFTMQLLIENVTKHNIISNKYPMVVDVFINPDSIVVKNPIRKKTSSSSSGIGLKYIKDQYKIFKKDFEIANDGEVFNAVIPYINETD